MNIPDEQLIVEAVAINHKRVGARTLAEYERHLHHYASYFRSAHGVSFYSARRKHVLLFDAHMAAHGGDSPDPLRQPCEWCAAEGYPDGKSGSGYSASYRKGFMAALRFIYWHFACEEDLPDHNPTSMVENPQVVIKREFTPTREEVARLLDAPGRPRDRLLAYWAFYAPSRRQTFVDARWSDINLDEQTWDVVGKGSKADCFDLHPILVRELRRYRNWQQQQAKTNRMLRSALSSPETAYVLLSCNGCKLAPSTVTKQLKWRAVRAGVAVVRTRATHDCPQGLTSQVCPHALRRAWANFALNDDKNPVPIEVVAQVLNHKDISTTLRHYAHSKPERARNALRRFHL